MKITVKRVDAGKMILGGLAAVCCVDFLIYYYANGFPIVVSSWYRDASRMIGVAVTIAIFFMSIIQIIKFFASDEPLFSFVVPAFLRRKESVDFEKVSEMVELYRNHDDAAADKIREEIFGESVLN